MLLYGTFLTQDPIGLAGGVNLYGYAGNNPTSFSDPFGLCPDELDPDCPDEVFSIRLGPTLGFKYKAVIGVVEGELSVGASATAGGKQEIDPGTSEIHNSFSWAGKLGFTFKATAWGYGPKVEIGPRAGADAAEPRLKESPVEADGTVSVSGTIPLLLYGVVPAGGIQVDASINIPAAFRHLQHDLTRLFGDK